MKMIIAGLIALSSLSAVASEHVSLFKSYPKGGCSTLQESLSSQVKNFIQEHDINGRYTVVVVKADSPNPGCRLLVTLQDSDFKLIKRLDKTAKTYTERARNQALESLVGEITQRDGYVLHDSVEMYADFIKTNYEVESLYIVPKL